MSDLRDRLQAVIAQWRGYREQMPRSFNAEVFEPAEIERENTLIGCLVADLESLLSADPPQAQETPEDLVWTVRVFREDDGRYAAEYRTADGTEGGMGEYSASPIGALAELCSTLIKVAEDRMLESAVTGDRSPAGET